MEKVSAIIVTHNRFSLFKKCLDCVRKQTYSQIECIVVDDASTDETESYCKQQSDIIYRRIDISESRGANYARNIGIELSSGKYIAFCDDDDEWLPDKTEKQVCLFEQYPTAGFVYCGRLLIYPTQARKSELYERISPLNAGNLSKRILYTIPCVTSTIMYRRELLLKVGGFDEQLKFWQEYELSIRLCQLSEIYYVKEHLVRYLVDTSTPNRMSNKYRLWLNTPCLIYEKHKDLYQRLNIWEKWMYKLMYYSDAYNRSLTSDNIACIRRNYIKKIIYSIITLPFRVIKRLSIIWKKK